MRSHSLALLACFMLTGCMARSVDVLQITKASNETTSSVRPSEAVPAGDTVAAVLEETATEQVAVAAPRPPEGIKALALAAARPDPIIPAPQPASRPVSPKIGAIQRHRFRDAKPINFGKYKPQNYPVHGVDVSRWQGNIDWVTLRSQGANFAYIKATDGGDHLDPMFKTNWRGAHEAGLKRGAYHFFYWCRTAGEQADWFIRNVPRVEGALPPVIDVEYNSESSCRFKLSPARVREKMQVFMDKLEAHYGQRPIIYTAPDFYKDNLEGHFQNYPFWLRAVAQHPSRVYPGRSWVFWQYSGSGLSHGVSGKIDLNVFYGTEKQWRTWVGGQTRVAAN